MRKRLSRIKGDNSVEAAFIGTGTLFCVVAVVLAFL